jgi:hypothetical protein
VQASPQTSQGRRALYEAAGPAEQEVGSACRGRLTFNAKSWFHRGRMITRRAFGIAVGLTSRMLAKRPGPERSPRFDFQTLPMEARPFVLWMWMGCNISKPGLTRDLEAMKQAGIGGATIMSLSDSTTPWAGYIRKSPTPEIIAFTSDQWWDMVRHAALEARRLGLYLALHNCPGYESSGGPWVPPELSMQELIWSEEKVVGGTRFQGVLSRAVVDPHPNAPFPQTYIPSLGTLDKPVVDARRTYYRDIAALAVPAGSGFALKEVVDLTKRMNADGRVEWDVPPGEWSLLRFGHTTTGAMIQPAQWEAMGLECDKMSVDAVTFHVNHVLAGIRQHLGDLTPSGLKMLYFDSYEAGTPTWTPKMREEFRDRRGYEIIPWLPVFAGRVVGTDVETSRFKMDFDRTVHDLYRDCYWRTASRLVHYAGLTFGAEPYEGPWEISEVVPFLDVPTAEFWTTNNVYSPQSVDPIRGAADPVRQNILAAEAFTSRAELSHWTEHPAWLKPIGDAAFCAGINRLNLHHFVHQPWSEKHKPGNVMGQWGVHFGRNQTWWEPGKAWLKYLWRCQAVLQRGQLVACNGGSDFSFQVEAGKADLHWVRRRDGYADIFFLANVAHSAGAALCTFAVTGKQPELWDAVSGSARLLPDYQEEGQVIRIPLEFVPAGSFFIVFRVAPRDAGRHGRNFPSLAAKRDISGPWEVAFRPEWGGPASVLFEQLQDWSAHEQEGIKYYSGTATYKKDLVITSEETERRLYLDLGEVKHLARVIVNGRDLGVVWTAPWQVDVTGAVKSGSNALHIEVTNVWANRLIGDEQEPPDCEWTPSTEKTGSFLSEFPDWFLQGAPRPSRDRYTFLTWNYFDKASKLEHSGLLGPVRLLTED